MNRLMDEQMDEQIEKKYVDVNHWICSACVLHNYVFYTDNPS